MPGRLGPRERWRGFYPQGLSLARAPGAFALRHVGTATSLNKPLVLRQNGAMATMRYIVRDVGTAIAFYTGHLGFTVRQQFGPAMAILAKDDLTLWVAGPPASASRPMPDGRKPEPGGQQILCEDPSGNVVELFQPAASGAQ